MPYKFREIEARLKKLWYAIVRQKWSHVIFSNGKISFPVPKHDGKEISQWVEHKILHLLHLSKEEFKNLLD